LALDANSWKTIWLPRLRRFLQIEQGVVFVGVLISALFAVLKPGAPILFLGVCILTIGNLVYFLQTLAGRLYNNRPFPWNWVMYLPNFGHGNSFFLALHPPPPVLHAPWPVRSGGPNEKTAVLKLNHCTDGSYFSRA
jgi:hypothetical protein